MPECSRCHGRRVVRNGFTRDGRRQHRRNDCRRRFVADPQKRGAGDDRRAVDDGPSAERHGLAGTAWAVGFA